MRELPDEVVDCLIDYRESGGGRTELIVALQRNLAVVGWRLVPETVIPRAAVLSETARLLDAAASVEGPPSGISPSRVAEMTRYLEYLRDVAAAVLGVDLSTLDEHVEGSP